MLVADGELRLDRLLKQAHDGASWNTVRRWVTSGKVWVEGERVADPSSTVSRGSRVELRPNAPRPDKARATDGLIVHLDRHVVVVNKPAGISTVPYDERETDTLDRRVRDALAARRAAPTARSPGVVQRLDKETSGVLVFARTAAAKQHLQRQLRARSVHRRYLAIAHGAVDDATFCSRLVQNRGDGLRGSTDNPRLGRESITHVRAREALEGATLVECRLETGRTHQIRIHLAEAGHPLVGERVYVRDYEKPRITAPRLMLHAAELGFELPGGRTLRFEAPLPEDVTRVLTALRR